MIFAPSSCFEGLTEYGPGESFLSRLQSYDPALRAYKSHKEQAIVVFSDRVGKKVLELKVYREEGQTWSDLEGLIISRIPHMDVWRRHGRSPDAGKALDDELAEQLESDKQQKLRSAKSDRLYKLKDDVHRIRLDLGHRSKTVSFNKEVKP